MTPSKDILELANPSEATTPQASTQTKGESSQPHADAVSLEVRVRVHGSRTTRGAANSAPQTEPFEEQTSTMIVFPQGGVLRMSTPVSVGQMVVLTNLKTGHDAICRVLKVRAYAQGQSYVEIEFTHQQPGYWGVQFSSESPDASSKAEVSLHAPVAETPAAPVEQKNGSHDKGEQVSHKAESSHAPESSLPVKISPRLIAPSERAARPSKSDSAFADIGTHEDVQPAASATTLTSRYAALDAESKTHALDQALEMTKRKVLSDPTSPRSAHVHSAAVSEPQADEFDAATIAHKAEEVALPRATAGADETADVSAELRHAGGENSGASFNAGESFGARLGSASFGMSDDAATVRKNRSSMPLILGLAAILVIGLGAAAYFQILPFSFGGTKTSSVPAVPAVANSTAAQNPISQAPAPSPAGAPVAPTEGSGAQTNVNPPVVAEHAASPHEKPASRSVEEESVAKSNSEPGTAPKSSDKPADKPSAKVPDMFGALNAHPYSPTRKAESTEPVAAPTLEANSSAPVELPATALPAAAIPAAPSAEVGAPHRVSGGVIPPRLISSVTPIYPNLAKEARVQGDVVVTATVDANGHVSKAKAVSGSAMLRQAALDAVQRWRYEPAKLDGQSISAEVTVKVSFHD